MVWLEHYANIEGWSSHIHRTFPAEFESTNLSRDNLSRGIGRQGVPRNGSRKWQLVWSCFALDYLHVQTLVLTDVHAPFLGTPLVPLELVTATDHCGHCGRVAALQKKATEGVSHIYIYIYRERERCVHIYIYIYICIHIWVWSLGC